MGGGIEDLKALWQELRANVDRLADERQQYLDIFQHAEHAYLVTSGFGVIEDANGAAVDLLQRRKQYLCGKPLAALLAPSARPDFRLRLHGLAAGKVRAASWRTRLGSGAAEHEVRVDARVIGRPENGIGWAVRAAP